MERQLNNVVNFGIGCAQAISEHYQVFSERIKSSVSGLISEGEKSKDTAAIRVREFAGKASQFLRATDKKPKAHSAS